MDLRGKFPHGAENSSALKDEMKTSPLHQLDYESSDSETQSSVPSPQSGPPLNDFVEHSSLPPDVEMDAFSIPPTTGLGTSSQTENCDNSIDWIPNVNFLLPSFPDSTIPKLGHNPIQQTFSTDPLQTTTSYLDNVSNAQNQSNFAVNATLPTSPSFLPSIDTGHHDQCVSPSHPTSDVPSSSSLEPRPFSFTDDVFPASDLYADLMNVDPIYGNALDAETSFQPELYDAHMDPAQQQLVFTQNHSMADLDKAEMAFLGNAEDSEKSTNTHSTNRPPCNIENQMPGEGDTLNRQAKDFGHTILDGQNEHQYQIPELMKALEESRKELKTLKNELDSVSKKYNNLKKSCDQLCESRRTYKNLAERHENEIKEYRAQINTLSQNNRKLEENIKLDEQNRQTSLQKVFEEHKKKILGSLTKKQAEIESVLTQIKLREEDFIKERKIAWEIQMQADNVAFQSTLPASDGKTFSSVNTTRENVRTRHQERFGNGNTS